MTVMILFTPQAERQWSRLPAKAYDQIRKKLVHFAETGAGDLKRLKGRPETRLRVGDWRVVFYKEGANVIVVAVGNRRDIYD